MKTRTDTDYARHLYGCGYSIETIADAIGRSISWVLYTVEGR